ncbi:MAG: gliding motility protein GldL [Bacteroidetes bacterium]|nr:gliding motility protein GldL [Bacteroidota bacterium]
MSLAEITQGKKWKSFMAKLYGWGASVVILGALFKIMHFPGAGPMLIVGLGTEAIIFFFSAFEPVHEEYDWSLAYPELKYGHDENKGTVTQQLDDMLKDANVSPEVIGTLGSGLTAFSDTVAKITDISSAAIATDEYGKNVSQASQSVSKLNQKYEESSKIYGEFVNVSSEAKNKLSSVTDSSAEFAENIKSATSSLSGLNEKYSKGNQAFGELLNASTSANTQLNVVAGASQKLGQNMEAANSNLTGLSQNYEKGSQAISEFVNSSSRASNQLSSVAQVSGEYSGSMQAAVTSLKDINNSYVKAVDAMNALSGTTGATKSYGDQIEKMTKNLELLNSLYEIDMQDSNKKLVSVISELTNTTTATKAYTENIQQLSEKINSLNSIYLDEAEQARQRTGSIKKYYDSLGEILGNLSASAEGTKRYRDEIQALGENLASLNTIYGNMLTAMSFSPGGRRGN